MLTQYGSSPHGGRARQAQRPHAHVMPVPRGVHRARWRNPVACGHGSICACSARLRGQRTDKIDAHRVKMIPNEEDKGPLRAIISHAALVDPGHPLRKPGAEGIELYIGNILCATPHILLF